MKSDKELNEEIEEGVKLIDGINPKFNDLQMRLLRYQNLICERKGRIEERQRLIKEFLKDIDYIDTIVKDGSVFSRLSEIEDKWKGKQK